jgi:1,4-dihydroxy-2-naphthoate octaprenyltransferase
MKEWIIAARLRTLPLAFACIIAGAACAILANSFKVELLVLSLLTTLLLQILSNFANDYGDAVSGKDNAERIGPDRMVASGKISAQQMKKAVILFAVLSFLSGVSLIVLAFGLNLKLLITFVLIGVASIAAAIAYTVGKKPYGYSGLGDISVFIFFGLIGVGASAYLHTQAFEWSTLLPAASFGFLSAAVLNFNNMRDIENDKKTGKNTLAVKIGLQNAKSYQAIIMIGAFLCLIAFSLYHSFTTHQYLYLITVPYFMHLVKRMLKVNTPALMDEFLKKTALSTFALSILFLVSVLIENS